MWVDSRTFITANAAFVGRLFGTFGGQMAFIFADTAFASEGAGHFRVGTIGPVVSNFAAVEALSGQLLRFRTVAVNVTGLVATRTKHSG